MLSVMEVNNAADAVPEPDETLPAQKIGKGKPGPGRPRGSRDKVSKDRRDLIKTWFDTPKARKAAREVCEGKYLEEPKLAALAIHLHSMAHGKPVPQGAPDDHRSPLLFVTQHTIGSYDPLAAKAAALLARKQAALPAEGESYVPPDPTDPDALVVVEDRTLARTLPPKSAG